MTAPGGKTSQKYQRIPVPNVLRLDLNRFNTESEPTYEKEVRVGPRAVPRLPEYTRRGLNVHKYALAYCKGYILSILALANKTRLGPLNCPSQGKCIYTHLPLARLQTLAIDSCTVIRGQS